MAHTGAGSRPIALITARVARAQDTDLPLLESALRARDLSAVVVNWDDAAVDWSQFALAVLRSAWDYSARLREFLSWLDRAALATRIANPPAVIRWNLDKHYLGELQRAGLPTVPTAYVEPGDDAGTVLDQFLQEHGAAELIIKPAVGSGARDAQRHPRTALAPMRAQLSRLLAERRSVLLQPYLERIDEEGETALIYLNGEFSHAVCKSAVLRRGHGPMQALFAPEEIAVREAAAEELALGARVLGALPFNELLYARLDLVRDGRGAPCVLELELAEPSLYLGYSMHAPRRLAAGVAARARAGGD
jgi:glutathione synthase/RimK-type ligase-like ATP-grasp enzyme